jgi:hypothetical protein
MCLLPDVSGGSGTAVLGRRGRRLGLPARPAQSGGWTAARSPAGGPEMGRFH